MLRSITPAIWQVTAVYMHLKSWELRERYLKIGIKMILERSFPSHRITISHNFLRCKDSPSRIQMFKKNMLACERARASFEVTTTRPFGQEQWDQTPQICNGRKSVRWSAVPVPCLSRLWLEMRVTRLFNHHRFLAIFRYHHRFFRFFSVIS